MARPSARAKHHPFATSLTRTGKLDMANRKPMRTAEQKAEAKRAAVLRDGRYVSTAPVTMGQTKRRKVA